MSGDSTAPSTAFSTVRGNHRNGFASQLSPLEEAGFDKISERISSEREPFLNRHASGAGPPRLQHNRSFVREDLTNANCFGVIHRIRRDIKKCIETALTWEQLNSPKLIFSVIRPMQDAYMKLNTPCTIYALLLNRVHFASQQYTLSSISVNNTRGMVCELLAVKILRQLYEEDTSQSGVFRLAMILASAFDPFQNAPRWAIPQGIVPLNAGKRTGGVADTAHEAAAAERRMSGSALELAIVSEAKRFIRAVPTQRVINDIWRGKIVYSSSSFRNLIKDQYKRRPIMKYDAKSAPLLDHYRLRVPRIRAALEWVHFAILFVSYLVVMRTMQKHRMNGYEIFWVIYGFGFALDKFASLLELGWTVFSSNLWNGLDFIFVLMFIAYLPVRIIGLQANHDLAAEEALSILTCAGCILFPRFAFVTLSDNLLILSLRSMLAQFTRLMVLAVWCFGGFFLAFVTLGAGKYKASEITQWMVWIWFGLDSTGMQKSNHLHNYIGPTLMVIYACLSNTLLITVLVSILSNTFNSINSDAIAEQMFRRAASTFQGVKSDGIFSFQPPINIFALAVLWPAGFFMSAHRYHKIIVLFARITNLPLLILIHIVERHILFRDEILDEESDDNDAISEHGQPFWKRPFPSFSFFSGKSNDLDAVFECEDDLDDDALPEGAFSISHDGSQTPGHPRSASPAGTAALSDAERTARNQHASEITTSTPGVSTAVSEREQRRRFSMSMSEWPTGGGTLRDPYGSIGGGSTIKQQQRPAPALLSHLFGPKRDSNTLRFLDTEQQLLNERLDRIEEGQKRIEEALKGLGGGAD